MRRVRSVARRRYSRKEKIRIVLEGFRREVTGIGLCRREGIEPHSYYSWTKEYFRVVGWGYYDLVTVMDDSRLILAHKLQRDMTGDSFIEAVRKAVDRTGTDHVPVTDRTRLLSDNGPGYVLPGLQGLRGDGRNQAHPGDALAPPDQREAGAIPPCIGTLFAGYWQVCPH